MKKLLLLVLLFSVSCMSMDDYEETQALQEAAFSESCALELSQLFTLQEIKEGDWIRRFEWRIRLYKVENRLFKCSQIGKYLPSDVKLTPLSFTK